MQRIRYRIQHHRHNGRSSGLFNQPGLQSLDRYPHPLNASIGQLHPDALDIRPEGALIVLHQLKTNPAALLALTLVDDFASLAGALSCDGTNSGHDV